MLSINDIVVVVRTDTHAQVAYRNTIANTITASEIAASTITCSTLIAANTITANRNGC